MNKHTSDEVEIYIEKLRDTNIAPIIGEMLEELARRLRQEEEESKRDPVREPLPGDRMAWPSGEEYVWTENDAKNIELGETLSEWRNASKTNGATIIRRREMQ